MLGTPMKRAVSGINRTRTLQQAAASILRVSMPSARAVGPPIRLTTMKLMMAVIWGPVCAGAAGCLTDISEPVTKTPAVLRSEYRGEWQGDALPLYGLSRPRGRSCAQSGFRDFDFWVGEWNVFDPALDGKLGGTNVVTRELRGCAVEEHWTDLEGHRGRSLNTYDAASKTWNQLWMDHSGLALIISGTASSRRMVMTGDTPQGMNGPIVSNRLTWSRQSRDRVTQIWEVSEDGRTTWNKVFTGDYRRVRRAKVAAELINDFCTSPARARYHWFDFLVGEWDVHLGDHAGPRLGSLTVAKDVSDCLLESRFAGRGYEGKAFAALHFPTRVWHRTWIDEDGVRVALTGELVGSSMVFTGYRTLDHGASQRLRATWTPTTAEQISELWETSDDDGVTWTVARQFTLTTRSASTPT